MMPCMSSTPISIQHRPEQHTFEAIVEGHRCVADYQLKGSVMRMTHTFVHPSLEGRGIAAQLVQAALQWAREQGLKVDPVCSYVRIYLRRHSQWQDLQA
jgi:uncharacterized protein